MIQDITQIVLAKALDGTAMRHRAIADNLANVETPGYRRRNVSFESELRAALDSPVGDAGMHERGIEAIEPELTMDSTQPARQNGNNVDIDREMAGLAENTIRYQTILQSLAVKGAMLRTAIYEGRR